MSSDKHIVLITPGFPDSESDTTCIPPLQIYALELSKQLGIKLSIIALQYPNKKEAYDWNGIPVYPCFMGHSKWSYVFKWLKAKRILKALNRVHRISLVHAFWMNEAAFVSEKASSKMNIPFVITQMGQDIIKENRYLKMLHLEKAGALISVSEFQKMEFEKWNVNRVNAVIPWGIDSNSFENNPSRRRDIDILGVGSLIPLKNYLAFVKAVVVLRKSYPNLKVYLVGDGPEKDLLEDYINHNDLNNIVTLTGSLDRKDVIELMSRSRVFYHPSNYESQGYVFYEALWSGMNVVCPEIGVASPSLDGFYLSNDFGEQVELLKKQLSNDSYERKEWIPTMQNTVVRYIQLYDRVIAGA